MGVVFINKTKLWAAPLAPEMHFTDFYLFLLETFLLSHCNTPEVWNAIIIPILLSSGIAFCFVLVFCQCPRSKWIFMVSGSKEDSLIFHTFFLQNRTWTHQQARLGLNGIFRKKLQASELSHSSQWIVGCHSGDLWSSRLNALIKAYIPKWITGNDTASSVKWNQSAG